MSGAAPAAPAGSPAAGEVCRNCGAPLTGAYCARCGQRHRPGPLSARELAAGVVDHLFSVDSRLWRTVVGLSRDPGGLCRRYVAGRRVRYVNPFRYSLTITALYFLINTLADVDPGRVVSEVAGAPPSELLRGAQAFVRTHVNNLLFVAQPLFALLLGWFYRRAGYTFAERYAFVLFAIGHSFLLALPLVLVARFYPAAALAARLLLSFVYFAWAATRFFASPGPRGVVKALLAKLVFYLSIVPLAMALILLYALRHGAGG